MTLRDDGPESGGRRSGSATALIVMTIFLGVSGIGGGAVLLADQSGHLLGLPPDLLANAPVDSFLLPGMFLFLVMGVIPLIISYGLCARLSWASSSSLLISVCLIAWIAFEAVVVGFGMWLQYLYLGLGFLMLLLSLLPSVRRYSARSYPVNEGGAQAQGDS